MGLSHSAGTTDEAEAERKRVERDKCIGRQRRRQQPNRQRRAAQRRATRQTHADQHPLAPVTVDDHSSYRRKQRRGQHPHQTNDPDRRGSAMVVSEDPNRDRNRPPAGPGSAKRQLSAS